MKKKPDFFPQLATRRDFIRHGFCKTAGSAVLSNTVLDLLMMNRAMADQSDLSGYKALVCVFLNGGNDSNNLIIPTDSTTWTNYSNVRGPTLAIPAPDGNANTAQALTLKNGQAGYPAVDGHGYGLHPAMPEVAKMFNGTYASNVNAAKAAVMLNLGTLSYPLTKAQYTAYPKRRPPQLFSHSDQQVQWQTSIPDQPPISGWGGRIGDLFTSQVDQNAGGQISMAISLIGSSLFEVGNLNAAAQYSVGNSGAVSIASASASRLTTLKSILAADKVLPDLQTAAYGYALEHAINEADVVNTALTAQSTSGPSSAAPGWFSYFGPGVTTPNGGTTNSNSSLMNQLKMVARLIDLGSRPTSGGLAYNGGTPYNGFGMKRQIFIVQVGSYDTHTNQTNNTNATSTDNSKVILGTQANNLAEVSQSLHGFFKAMTDTGHANDVTAFTISDFSRTFQPNGQGTDHAWGGNHIVVGGAVKGGATYGKLPTQVLNGPDDTSRGSWIPTMAVDQYAAVLAKWFGVDDANIPLIFPNIGRFGQLTGNNAFM